MKYKIYKLFFAWQHEKEEKWLNKMSSRGLQLANVGFCSYVFNEGPPDEYTYRLELLNELPSHAKSVTYINFLEETGAEHIGSFFRWVYFRKKTSDGEFDLYSDIDSKIKHFNRIRTLIFIVGMLNVMPFINEVNNYFRQDSPLISVISIIQLLLITLLSIGAISITKKIGRLKKEKIFRE